MGLRHTRRRAARQQRCMACNGWTGPYFPSSPERWVRGWLHRCVACTCRPPHQQLVPSMADRSIQQQAVERQPPAPAAGGAQGAAAAAGGLAEQVGWQTRQREQASMLSQQVQRRTTRKHSHSTLPAMTKAGGEARGQKPRQPGGQQLRPPPFLAVRRRAADSAPVVTASPPPSGRPPAST